MSQVNGSIPERNEAAHWTAYLLLKVLTFLPGLLTVPAPLICSETMGGRNYDFIVAQDGTGDFLTVQEAIHAVPDFRKNTTTIFIRNGTYREKLILPASKTMVCLIGESREHTILSYDDYASRENIFGEEMGTTGSSSFFVFADDFTAANITFENSAGPVGQAVAVRIDGDRVAFVNCRFSGFQDTLYPHGENSRQYYKGCIIEGTVDFIFGWSTAVFEECEIICRNQGYITAASTPESAPHGFVFLRCRIGGPARKGTFFLGRPWRPYAKVAFIECELGRQIKPQGWDNWRNPENEKTASFSEYMNRGPGADTSGRVPWSRQLSREEAERLTPEKILTLKDWPCYQYLHRMNR